MTKADLSNIVTLEIAGARGPAGWIEWSRRNYVEHGFGLWVMETHAGDFIGDCGLTMQEVEGELLVEAGWHVRTPARRRGYAAEAAEAVRAAARDGGVEHLIAIIRPTTWRPSGWRRRSDWHWSARFTRTVAQRSSSAPTCASPHSAR